MKENAQRPEEGPPLSSEPPQPAVTPANVNDPLAGSSKGEETPDTPPRPPQDTDPDPNPDPSASDPSQSAAVPPSPARQRLFEPAPVLPAWRHPGFGALVVIAFASGGVITGLIPEDAQSRTLIPILAAEVLIALLGLGLLLREVLLRNRLAENHNRLLALFGSDPNPLLVLNGRGQILYRNTAAQERLPTPDPASASAPAPAPLPVMAGQPSTAAGTVPADAPMDAPMDIAADVSVASAASGTLFGTSSSELATLLLGRLPGLDPAWLASRLTEGIARAARGEIVRLEFEADPKAAPRSGSRERSAIPKTPMPGGARQHFPKVWQLTLWPPRPDAPLAAGSPASASASALIREEANTTQAFSRPGSHLGADSGLGADTGRDTALTVPAPDTQLLCRLEDISAQRAADRALEAEQARLVDLLANLPVGVFSVERNGRFRYVSETMARWLGYTTAEMMAGGLRLHDIIADTKPATLAAHDPFCRAEGEDRSLVRLLSRSGEIIETRIAQSVNDPLFDPDHPSQDPESGFWTRAVARRLSISNDWEEALRRSEHRFAQIFEAAPVGIVQIDPQANVSAINRAFRDMVQPSRSRITGQPIYRYIAEEHIKLLRQHLEAVHRGERPTAPIEVRLVGKAGIEAQLFVSVNEDVIGTPTGFILHFLDATENKRLERQMAQSQKMQAVGLLAGGVAHDFNNMLTAITGHCDLLLQRHRQGEQSFADIMQIKQSANRAANLVRQLLAFSRQQPLQPRVLCLTDALGELTHLLRRLIGENIELKVIHGRDLHDVKVDLGQLEQVIINLAVNARDAMNHPGQAPGGTLSIRTSNVSVSKRLCRDTEEMPPGDYVLIEASDTGCGIPPDIIARIFEPFFSTKEVGSGTGLGLSTVYGIVKQTGGFVFVDSTVNVGTIFSIYLPRYHPTQEELESAKKDSSERTPIGDLTGTGSVLLVEDEDSVRLFGARALRNKGYKVVEARCGEQALQIMSDQGSGIDLLITDVVMPQMDGPELINKVREMRQDLKVIFISGYTEDSFRQRLNQDADIHFLPKPFTLKQLAAKVREVMRGAA